MRIENSGVVEQDVQRPKGIHRFAHGTVALRCMTNVGAYEDRLPADGHDRLHYSLTAFLVAAGNSDFRALAGKKQGRGFTNAGRASGNQGDSIDKAHGETTHKGH